VGKKKVRPFRAVLDTNVLVSALLFNGRASKLLPLLKSGRVVVPATKEILAEYVAALSYPKFKLTEGEVAALFTEEIIPHVEAVKNVAVPDAHSRDPDDDKFIACALASKSDALATGDGDLLSLKGKTTVPIMTIDELLNLVG
jgi:putative PIN family toxin of toxin-antitoxin system